VFVGPFVIGLVVFVYIPIAWSIYLSFFDSYNTVTPTKFVGLGNYLDMLGDPAFRSSLLTFLAFAVFIVPTTFVLSSPRPCSWRAPGSCRRSSARSSSCRRRAPTSSRR